MKDRRTRRIRRSFMGQLLLRMSVLIAIPIAIITILFQSVKEIIIEKYGESAQQSVKIAADNIDYLLGNVQDISNSILTNHDLLNELQEHDIEAYMEGLSNYYISNFYVEGIYTKTASEYAYVGARIVDNEKEERWEDLKNISGGIKWFPTRIEQLQILTGRQERSLIMVGRKMIDVSSLKELGYLKIAIDESVLKEVYGTLENDGGKIIICDREGQIISNTENDLTPIIPEEHSYMQEILSEDESGYVEYEENGISNVAIYSGLNEGEWRIIKEIPKNELYAEINRIQEVVILVCILFIVSMFLISYIFSQKITDPLKRLISQMKEVEEGNLDVTVEINTNREVHELGEGFNHMIYRVKNLMNEVVRTERNKNELELEVLHAQINPHFLYNTLNTIRWMAKLKGETKISDAIVALVKLLRISISVDKNMITVREEISYVENYLLIQRLRFNQSFEIEYVIHPEIEDRMIPKLILQPIVENSLIYSIDEAEEEENKKPLKIRIFTEITDEKTAIVVEDNGIGIEEDKLGSILRGEKDVNKFSKVGLNNVNQRVKMYFGDTYGIKIQSKRGTGTRVEIPIPIVVVDG